jgi:streptogramin lyase
VAAAAASCGRGDGPTGDGDSSASSGIDLDSSSGAASDDGSHDEGPEKLDVAGGAEGPGGDCPGGGMPGGEYEFSVIWIANTGEGTVSKIDTKTATELARYRTGPDDNPDPSRTSVNLDGAVAVTNRSGSVIKIAAEESRCVDVDGSGSITTSQAPTDVLPWGSDECVLWFHDIAFDQTVNGNAGGPRGTAWDAGDSQANPCDRESNLWVGWRDQPNQTAIVRRIDGETGQTIGEASIPDWQCNWGHGPYGGAADKDGAFWGLGTLGTLARIDPDTFEVQLWDNPTPHVLYGIALDANGDPWMAGWDGHLWWFDRSTESWNDMGDTMGGPSRMRGLAIDKNGRAWIAGNNGCALVEFDTVGKTLVSGEIPLPDCGEPVGVSIDVDGFVWVVDRDADRAFKVDPDDYSTVTVGDLVGPYTYSDMTGAGLDLVVNPPTG